MAVPSSQAELDWWANADGRYSRYARLFRVWSDPTDVAPQPFYRSWCEKHVVYAIWENFALFDPRLFVTELYRLLNFPATVPATDICWSYEFNLRPSGRQVDLVLHVRFPEWDEVIVGEAKPGKKKFGSKELEPESVLDENVFRIAHERRYFLLGDAIAPADWNERGYGALNWQELYGLQQSLCNSLPESPEVQSLIRSLIGAQFGAHGIGPTLGDNARALAALVREAARLKPTIENLRYKNFITSAVQHLLCLTGVASDSLPFPYLAAEPAAIDIKPGWRQGCGCHVVNGKCYWRLPPTSSGAV